MKKIKLRISEITLIGSGITPLNGLGFQWERDCDELSKERNLVFTSGEFVVVSLSSTKLTFNYESTTRFCAPRQN